MTLNPMVAALQRLSGREMLINPETTDEFVASMTRFATTTREEASSLEATSREAVCAAYGIDDRAGDDRKPFIYQDGVAVIPVHGALINRFNSSWGFVTGYNFIRRQMNLILDDEDVEYFVFDVNTPGGEASGCFELGREILASRRVKPSLAMVDSLMASGGVGVAGCASRITAIPSARIGSIGVYRQHISVEGALDQAGVKITFAKAGDHKIDGNPYEDLPAGVLRDWTEDVNKTWDDFIALVAEARGLSEAEVRATQARVYRADEALAKGLINTVNTTAEAVPAFVAEMGEDQPDDEEEDDMTTETNKGKGAEVASGVDYEKIGTMISGAVSTAVTTLFAAQSRATAIKDHGKAKGQVALATKLAANDKITEAEAIEMIDDAASAAAPKGKGGKVKGQGKRERVQDGGDDDGDGDDEDNEDGDEDGEGDEGDEDEADQARAARRGSNVHRLDRTNHVSEAMKGKGAKVGAGKGDDDAALKGDAAATDSLLADHALMTGTDLRKKA